MKLLLDTHSLLWYAEGDAQLSGLALNHIQDPANDLYLSMASVWEVAIKCGLKKLQLAGGYRKYLSDAIRQCGAKLVPISFGDCVRYESLAFPSQHRDPFDRMIITHTFQHGLDVLGADTSFDAYGLSRIW